jgi:hypothetical protein
LSAAALRRPCGTIAHAVLARDSQTGHELFIHAMGLNRRKAGSAAQPSLHHFVGTPAARRSVP